MVSAEEIVNGTVSLLAAKGKIKNIRFNAPDGSREGELEEVRTGDLIIVRSWPEGDTRGDKAFYQIQCKDYALGGDYPPNVFWAFCTMTPVVRRDGDYVPAPESNYTEGTILFFLQPSKGESNMGFTVLVGAIASLIFLI